MKSVLIIFLGGGLGSSFRYIIGLLANHVNKSTPFPWATLSINLLGSLIIGVVTALFLKEIINKESHLFLAVGLCGGFTTFSTFSNELFQLMKEEQFLISFLYLMSSILFGVIAVAIGYTSTRYLLNLQ